MLFKKSSLSFLRLPVTPGGAAAPTLKDVDYTPAVDLKISSAGSGLWWTRSGHVTQNPEERPVVVFWSPHRRDDGGHAHWLFEEEELPVFDGGRDDVPVNPPSLL